MKFREDLEGQGFKFNPSDPCVANRMIKSTQHTVVFYVYHLKSSRKDPKVNDDFAKFLEETYGKHGRIKRSKVHEYLVMKLDF